MLYRLAKAVGTLSKAENRVAEAVLANPELAVNGTLRDVAIAAGVSEPTALRFCRSFGFHSFRDFRIALAQDLASRGGEDTSPVTPVTADDTIVRSTHKVFAGTLAAVREAQARVDAREIEQAATALARARRIDIYGLGASALVAADAQHKLFRITNVATAYQDAHMQLMAAATLGLEDCALAISHSGATLELLDFVAVAKEGGATVIAITRPGSPLAREAHISISVSDEERTELFTPMTSRITHLVVVDALTVALALMSPPANRERHDRMTRAIATRRLQEDEANSRAG